MGGRGFANDYATCYCNKYNYCKSDYGGEGGGKNSPKFDYVICELSLSIQRRYESDIFMIIMI